MSSEFPEPKPHRPSNDPKVKAWEKRKKAWEKEQAPNSVIFQQTLKPEHKMTSRQMFVPEPKQLNENENISYPPYMLNKGGSSKKYTIRSRKYKSKSRRLRKH